MKFTPAALTEETLKLRNRILGVANKYPVTIAQLASQLNSSRTDISNHIKSMLKTKHVRKLDELIRQDNGKSCMAYVALSSEYINHPGKRITDDEVIDSKVEVKGNSTIYKLSNHQHWASSERKSAKVYVGISTVYNG